MTLFRYILLLLITSALVLPGCKSDAPQQAPTVGSISGKVIDLATGQPVPGAIVSSIPPTQSVTADGSGTYKMTGVTPGTYNLRAVKSGYNDGTATVAVVAGGNTVADIPISGGGSTGNKAPIAPHTPVPGDGATIEFNMQQLSWLCSDADGDELRYDVYLGKTNPPTTELINNTPATHVQASNLEMGVTYYWFVVARDNKGGQTIGPVWRFTTKPPTKGTVLKLAGPNGYNGKDQAGLAAATSALALGDKNLTIEGWVRLSRRTQYAWIVAKGHANNDLEYLLGIINGKLHYGARATATSVSGGSQLDTGRWYHVAVVQNNISGSVTLYLNGAVDGSGNISGSAPAASANVYIGAREFSGMPSEGLVGSIYDLRIWNRVRSMEEINASRFNRLTGQEPGLVAYWKMNEGEGSTLLDATGAGHGAMLLNEPTWIDIATPFQ